MSLNKLQIGDEISRGWNLFKSNMGFLVAAGLVSVLLTAVTCGILGAPMMAGMLMIVERLQRNDPVKPTVGDLFKGFEIFIQAIILMVICIVAASLASVVPVLGQLLGIVISAFMVWGMMRLVFTRKSAIDVLKEMFAYLTSGDLTMPLLLGFIASLIASAGALLCLVGFFFTAPISYCILVSAYETVFGSDIKVVAEQSETPVIDV